MHITILSNEYPPNVYGGAGVHVEYLTHELAVLDDRRHRVEVFCFGEQSVRQGNLSAEGVTAPGTVVSQDPRHQRFLDTLLRNLAMTGRPTVSDVVHCHTWYSHLAGCLVKQLYGVPLVLTTHSLEPHRPWKAEQLGTAYQASTWIERTAYQNADGVVAVSQAMRRDVHELYNVPFENIRVIHNGIDLTQYRPTLAPETLERFGIAADQPFVLFVGRITRQKGIVHLVNAIRHLTPGTQVVLCAGAPDTPEIGQEMTDAVERARHDATGRVIWIREMLSKDLVIHLYSHAAVFVCPSVYEPFGIINLEAMACETPVVASAVGGIPEVVTHGETGLLVPITPTSDTDVEPRDPDQFAHDLAAGINQLMADPVRRQAMASRARARVEADFGWPSIARQTLDFYQMLIDRRRKAS